MNSIFNRLLINLQTKLMADVPDNPSGARGIRYIDQDLGQLDIYETVPNVSFPCVLVDFVQTQYREMQGSQWAKMTIILRLGFNPYSGSSNLTPEEYREKALEYYEIEDLIFKSLQDWNGEGLLMNPMIRKEATTEKRQDIMRVRTLTYEATYNDQG